MKKVGSLIVAALMLWAFAGYGGSTTHAQGMANEVTFQLNEQNGSGQNGTAVLSEANGQLTVTINLSNGTTTPQPAHIHRGTCANLDPAPAIPLDSVVNGRSTSNIDLTTNAVAKSLSDITNGQFAINVHKSATEVTVYVACGDLVAMQTGGAGQGTGTGTGTGAGGTGTGTGAGTGAPGMPRTGAGDQTLPLAAIMLVALSALTLGLRLKFAGRKV